MDTPRIASEARHSAVQAEKGKGVVARAHFGEEAIAEVPPYSAACSGMVRRRPMSMRHQVEALDVLQRETSLSGVAATTGARSPRSKTRMAFTDRPGLRAGFKGVLLNSEASVVPVNPAWQMALATPVTSPVVASFWGNDGTITDYPRGSSGEGEGFLTLSAVPWLWFDS